MAKLDVAPSGGMKLDERFFVEFADEKELSRSSPSACHWPRQRPERTAKAADRKRRAVPEAPAVPYAPRRNGSLIQLAAASKRNTTAAPPRLTDIAACAGTRSARPWTIDCSEAHVLRDHLRSALYWEDVLDERVAPVTAVVAPTDVERAGRPHGIGARDREVGNPLTNLRLPDEQSQVSRCADVVTVRVQKRGCAA